MKNGSNPSEYTNRPGARRPNGRNPNVSRRRRPGRTEKLQAYAEAAPIKPLPARPGARYAAISTIRAETEAPKANQGAPSSRPKNVSNADGNTNGQGTRNLNEKRLLDSGQRNDGRNAMPHDWHLRSEVLRP